jgi:AraC family transcriptional regulator, melibiose operon regulatory protein
MRMLAAECYLDFFINFRNRKLCGNCVAAQIPEQSSMSAIVFDDHRFCAGRSFIVETMPAPHTHSQVELNLITQGHMDYRFNDGMPLRVEAGKLIFFWGAKPHQVVGKASETRFVCLYMPVSTMLTIGLSDRLRAAVFAGGVIEAKRFFAADADTFGRWHEDLTGGDPRFETVVRDEVSARLRRIDLDGWQDLLPGGRHGGIGRVTQAGGIKVEQMARFIDEHAHEEIDVAEIAQSVGLHPNYAMAVFRKSLGITINQYLTRHRLDAAHSLLFSSEDDVAAIAFECGFGSLSRFYEAFRDRYGVSPAEFRRRHRRLAA